jgi:ATP/maltotriose-dependent transcriptional regulator MalT
LLGAGVLAVWQGAYAHGCALLEASLTHFKALDDRHGIARAHYELANAAWIQGDYAQAVPGLAQTLALARTLGDALLIIRCVGSLAQAATLQGDTARAMTLLDEGLALARALSDSQRIAMLLMTLAFCRLQEDALAEAEAAAREALARFAALGERWLMLYPFLGLAAVATGKRRAQHAARLLGQAEALSERLTMPVMPALRPWQQTVVAAAQAQLREDLFHQAWAEGRAMPLEEAVAYALEETGRGTDEAHSCAHSH